MFEEEIQVEILWTFSLQISSKLYLSSLVFLFNGVEIIQSWKHSIASTKSISIEIPHKNISVLKTVCLALVVKRSIKVNDLVVHQKN